MSTLQLITEVTQLVPMAGDDIIGFTQHKVNAVGSLFRTGSIVIAIGFVLFQAIVSRGAMARIIVSGVAAAVFVWIVFNVTDLKDRVDNEMNSAPAVGAPAHHAQV